jgi:hypothetical protein
MTDVFISYKREQRAQCARIAEKLRALGLDVWFDAKLESGTSFDAEIEARIHAAKAVLVLWSPEAAKSNWVRNEATIGQERNVLVSVEIAPCTRPVQFTTTHTEALHNPQFRDDDPAFARIVARIGRLSGRADLAGRAEIETTAPAMRRKAGWVGPVLGVALAAALAGGGFVVWRMTTPAPTETVAAITPAAPAPITPAPSAPATAAAPTDVCAGPRADWDALQSTRDIDLITQFLAATPPSCAIVAGLARERRDDLQAQQIAAAKKITDAAQIDQAFAGTWVPAEGRGGPCGLMPWRFTRDGDYFIRTNRTGDKDKYAIQSANPPTLRFTATGLRIIAENDELVVIPGDDRERCFLRRQ